MASGNWKNIKRLIACILLAIFLLGCSFQSEKLASLQKQFPDAKIYSLNGKDVFGNEFIVRDANGSVYYVAVTGRGIDISNKILLWNE